MKKRVLSILLCLVLCCALLPATALAADMGLQREWQRDQDFTLADPAPWDLEELKQVVDVTDPRSVAAYWVWSVNRLVDDYDDGMAMMKYLFADIEPFGRGYTEGGMSGQAGWDSYFNERLRDSDYSWLPRAYFEGASTGNGFKPNRPLTIELYYNSPNTETINEQTLSQLGRLNIVYWVQSHAGNNQVNITLSRFDGSDRWYVTSGTSSTALFYDQRSAVGSDALALARAARGDDSTAEEHQRRYGTAQATEPDPEPDIPFTDVAEDSYYADAVAWAYEQNVTKGTSDTTFGPLDSCTRGQVVTFLWRAANCPRAWSRGNPFQDVNPGDYYYEAVLWAVQEGITGGTSFDTFSPDQTCSSAHIVTFLYRALGIGDNGWYEEARSWAVDSGLLDGTGIFVGPDETCPRGAVVTFLYRGYGME